MSIGINGSETVEILILIFLLMQLGLSLSGIGYVSHRLQSLLSRYTRIDQPGPTVWRRMFRLAFDRLFAPIGYATADRSRSPVLRKISFQVSIGLTVIAFAGVIYVLTAGVMIGTAIATYQISGNIIDPVPPYRLIIAFVTLCALSVMFYAGSRAKSIPTV